MHAEGSPEHVCRAVGSVWRSLRWPGRLSLRDVGCTAPARRLLREIVARTPNASLDEPDADLVLDGPGDHAPPPPGAFVATLGTLASVHPSWLEHALAAMGNPRVGLVESREGEPHERSSSGRPGAGWMVVRRSALAEPHRTGHPMQRPRLRPGVRTVTVDIGEPMPPYTPLGPPAADIRVLFLLPARGGSGGVHSIVQECHGMNALGAFAQVAIPRRLSDGYRRDYPDFPRQLFHVYDGFTDLSHYAATFHVAVATIYTSVELLGELKASRPRLRAAYYVQDYEPWFAPPGSEARKRAAASYTALPDALAFAKTDWIRDMVASHHSVVVEKVVPSIDHEVYRPRPRPRPQRTSRLKICAMVRPSTARRNASGTMRVLADLERRWHGRVEVAIFGCPSWDRKFRPLERAFDYRNHGRLTRARVAQLLQSSDVFVDLSLFQAFGRTALEAMACGCSVVLTRHGGIGEYAVDGDNCLLVDPADEPECVATIERLLSDDDLRARLRRVGLETARRYSVEAAAASELALLRPFASPLSDAARETNRTPRPGVPFSVPAAEETQASEAGRLHGRSGSAS